MSHLQALVMGNHADRSTIQNLPFELIEMIITMAVLPQGRICEMEEEPPLAVMLVCHAWKRWALSIPKLWCRLLIDTARPAVKRLNNQLTHSANSPLSVRLTAQNTDNFQAAVAIILPHQHRIASLCLDGPQDFFSIFSGKIATPVMEEIHFHSMDWSVTPESHIDFGIAPRRVTLEVVRFEDIRIDWTNVTSMCLTAVALDGTLPPFDGLKSLKKLELELDGWVPPDDFEVVVNQTIEELSLQGENAAEIVINTISMPSLQRLRINIVDVVTFNDEICRFLGGCDLKVLEIQDYSEDLDLDETLATEALITALDATQSLRELIIGSQDVSVQLVLILVDHDWLPGLQNLTLSVYFDPDDNLSDFVTHLDAIQGRSPNFSLFLSFDTKKEDLPRDIVDRLNEGRWQIAEEDFHSDSAFYS